MKKRSLFFVLVLILFLALTPLSVFADFTQVIPFEFDSAFDFSEGLAVVRRGDKFGYIDKTGGVVIPFIYDFASPFYGGSALVEVGNWVSEGDERGELRSVFDGERFSIDKSGARTEPADIDFDGMERIIVNGKMGFVNESGIEVVPPIYDWAGDFSDGLAEIQLDGKWGFIDKSGDPVVPPKYDEISWAGFTDGLVAVAVDGKWGFVDLTGAEIVTPKYDDVGAFSEGFAQVGILYENSDLHRGFIDRTGKEIVPLIYDLVQDFSEGLAAVSRSVEITVETQEGNHTDTRARWGFVDTTGREVIPPKYDEIDLIRGFSDGLMAVGVFSEWVLWGSWESEDGEMVPELFGVDAGRLYGFIDKTGKEVIPFVFNTARNFFDGLAAVGVLDEETWEMKYGFITTAVEPAPADVTVTFNGSPLTFDVAPQIIFATGRTMVPLRAIFEAMGATVAWDGITQTATAVKDDTTVILTIGDNSPTINGVVSTIDQPAILVEEVGRTLAPLRFVAEAFGGTVEWDNDTQTAHITLEE